MKLLIFTSSMQRVCSFKDIIRKFPEYLNQVLHNAAVAAGRMKR